MTENIKPIILNVYTGNMYNYYLVRKYMYYAITVLILLFFLKRFYLILTPLLFLGILISNYTIFIVERRKKAFKAKLKIEYSQVTIFDMEKSEDRSYDNIASMKIFFDSFFGRSYISLWHEMGYNRLIFVDNNGVKHRLLFLIENKRRFEQLKEFFFDLKNNSAYHIEIFDRRL